ncbi:hypothetical protein [Polyangium mundeleinium]|uniref:Uncharacterized protein n=1 Tax=Polyangium mundeleinium TaxID=2995306 RepID=A0ABT5EZT5_9BACT|nr:hypothetical protein [Polyangium mundeleinium]MDC0740142.1 hypothetical protein [Polyangium mundeleinium]MDC0746688.1 hypothetical protein [Polyangium mundeleinium]
MDAQAERNVVVAVVAFFMAGWCVVPTDGVTVGTYAQQLAIESVQAIRAAAATVEPETFGRWLASHVMPNDVQSARAGQIAKAITIAGVAEVRTQAAFQVLGIAIEVLAKHDDAAAKAELPKPTEHDAAAAKAELPKPTEHDAAKS